MTEDQFQEAIRLRDSGMSVSQAAEAVGASKGSFSGIISRRGLQTGRGAKPKVLTNAQVLMAVTRHKAGETWSDIAKSFGFGRTTLCHRTESCEPEITDEGKRIKNGCYSAATYEPHRPREVRRVIKPADEVKALAQKFASGEISRAEFVMGIWA